MHATKLKEELLRLLYAWRVVPIPCPNSGTCCYLLNLNIEAIPSPREQAYEQLVSPVPMPLPACERHRNRFVSQIVLILATSFTGRANYHRHFLKSGNKVLIRSVDYRQKCDIQNC